MELERLCKRVNNIPNSIERAYVKDITSILIIVKPINI